jgi:non-ribosomal peptide synthase protein (TIGR01720 family)
VLDVLLAGLGMALGSWLRAGRVVVQVEGHGRQDAGGGADVSRTVGWFTCAYPVVLEAGGGDPAAALRAVREHLRAVPRHGLGYGLLRYLTDDLTHATDPEISFRYREETGGETADDRRFRLTSESLGQDQPRDAERGHLIEINCEIVGGQLDVVWTYGAEVHDEATIARLAHGYTEALNQLIDHCCSPGARDYAPSDFPLAGLSQQALDAIQQRFGSPARPGEHADSGG